MKILYIGCVQSSLTLFEELLSCPDAEIVGVITKEASSINSDFHSLLPYATKLHIPCFIYRGKESDGPLLEWTKRINPEVIYCWGWSHLLPQELIQLPPVGIIGYHPTQLPCNRGRHPIIWTLALGLKETASTFFLIDSGVDTGDIMSQVHIDVSLEDDASSLYDKLMSVAKIQVRELTADLAAGKQVRVKQDVRLGNTWRKRSKADGVIDWRMSSITIYNLVRALTKPYPGAELLVQGEERKVWKARLADEWSRPNLEPGRILEVSGNEITVQCGVGALTLLDHQLNAADLKEGDSLI